MQTREFLNYRLNIAGRRLSTLHVNQTNLNGKLRKTLGANRGSRKNLGGNGPPRPALGIHWQRMFVAWTKLQLR